MPRPPIRQPEAKASGYEANLYEMPRPPERPFLTKFAGYGANLEESNVDLRTGVEIAGGQLPNSLAFGRSRSYRFAPKTGTDGWCEAHATGKDVGVPIAALQTAAKPSQTLARATPPPVPLPTPLREAEAFDSPSHNPPAEIEDVDQSIADGESRVGPQPSEIVSTDIQSEPSDGSEEDRKGWDPVRRGVARCLEMPFPGTDINMFDTVMSVVVMFNVCIMIAETDADAVCPDGSICEPDWVTYSNDVLLAIYTLELAMRLTAYRLQFFRVPWNYLDLFIVSLGYAGMLIEDASRNSLRDLQMFRMFRVARVIRVAKILKRFKTLHSMVAGFSGAMQAMAWGLILIMLLLVVWSLIAVELVQPVNERLEHHSEFCEKAFSSVLMATLLFFQTLVAGDPWEGCITPVILAAPMTFTIFALAVVTVQMGFTNLILAVIVDKAAEAREGSQQEKLEERKKQEAASIKRWIDVMKSMDTDMSGTITYNELLSGYQNPVVKETLQMMQINKSDLRMLFDLIDCEGSGSLGYDEFVGTFKRFQMQDTRMSFLLMNLHVRKIEHKMEVLTRSMQDLVGQSNQAASARRPGPASRSKSRSGSGFGSWREDAATSSAALAPPRRLVAGSRLNEIVSEFAGELEGLSRQARASVAAADLECASEQASSASRQWRPEPVFTVPPPSAWRAEPLLLAPAPPSSEGGREGQQLRAAPPGAGLEQGDPAGKPGQGQRQQPGAGSEEEGRAAAGPPALPPGPPAGAPMQRGQRAPPGQPQAQGPAASPRAANTPDGERGVAPALKSSQSLILDEFREMRSSLEGRFEALAAEAAELSAHLAQQHCMLRVVANRLASDILADVEGLRIPSAREVPVPAVGRFRSRRQRA